MSTAPTKTPAEMRAAALRLLTGEMAELDEEGEPIPLTRRRMAAEAILKHVSEEESAEAPKRVLEMSDQDLLQVIVEAREAREAVVVPTGTSDVSRGTGLAAALAGLADIDPLLT